MIGLHGCTFEEYQILNGIFDKACKKSHFAVCRYLQDNDTRQDSAMVEGTLEYYISALIETIGNGSVSTSFAGQNSTDSNSTLAEGITSYDQCGSSSSSSNGGGISGFFQGIGSAISNAVSRAACQISNTVNSVEMELDAAKGFLDRAAAESPGQTNATFTNVDVSLLVWVMLYIVLYQTPDISCLNYDM